MKIFIVDVCNCLELSHFETFFYKNIKNGNISLYGKSVTALSMLEDVHTWLVEEINRNPFQIKDSMVVFYIPRNITKTLPLDRYEAVVKMYISQLISSRLDLRFRFCCVFLDETDHNLRDDAGYEKIKTICEAGENNLNLRSDDPLLREGFFPSDITQRPQSVKTLENEIEKINDPVLREFYRNIFLNLKNNLFDNNESYLYHSFFQSCDSVIKKIRHMTVPHFGGDISEKTEMLIKLIDYVCSFAAENSFIEGVNNPEFEKAITRFISTDNYNSYVPDYERIKESIATYRNRLTDWLNNHSKISRQQPERIEKLKYEETNEFKSFESEVDRISIEEIADRVLNPDLRKLKDFHLSDAVFSVLDEILSTATTKLKSFGDKVVKHMTDFRAKNPMYETDNPDNLEEEETAEEQQLISAMNDYITNGLPGFSEELKLRQDLDIIDKKIHYLAKPIEKLKMKAFLLTLCTAVLLIALFYLGAQYTVFMKEYSWAVFGIYCLVCGATFLTSYQLTKSHYLKKLRELIDESKQLISAFLYNYKKRAEEFENNINSAMRFYCYKDYHNKLSETRNEEKRNSDKFLWHKRKIADILSNLRFFDGFTKNISPREEENPPKLESFDDDAVHNDFYQMPEIKKEIT